MNKEQEKTLKFNIQINIKRFRLANGLSQQQVADAFGFERSTYGSWETGRSCPNIAQLYALSVMYNRDISDFLEGSETFCVNYDDSEIVYGDKYLSDLSDEDRTIVLKYRMLNKNDKDKVNKFIDELKNIK